MLNFSAFPLSVALARTLLVIALIALRLPAAAQAPAWQSARAVATATAAASSNFSEVTATAVDAMGNVFLAGQFRNTVVLGGTTLTSLGEYDLFVAKFNPASNQFVWAQRAGGTRYEVANALAVSGTSVYVAGEFDSYAASFGPATLTNTGTYNVFVAKLTDAGSTGSFAWAQRAGGTGADAVYGLAVSGTNVYVTGNFTSSPAVFGTAALSSVGSNDVFVAKLTDAGSTGNFVWVQRAGSPNYDSASALAVSGTSVYVGGFFTGFTADFGSAILTNAGNYDGFVAKLTDAGSTGSFIWAQRAGGAGNDFANALAVSGPNVYVAGTFGIPTAGFGAITLTNTSTTDNADVFVAKLADAGGTSSYVWAQRAGGTENDFASSLAVRGTNVYVAGTFASSTAGFGTTILTNAGGNAGTYDVYVAKLTDAGGAVNFNWAQQAGGINSEQASTLATSGTGVYLAGYIQSPSADFGAINLFNSNPNSYLGFLASLTDATLTATSAAAGPREPAALFPNPARHTATLRLPAGTAPAPLTLTDAQGRAVRRYPAPAGPEAVLDLGGLPAGLYLLRGAGSAQRLVVE